MTTSKLEVISDRKIDPDGRRGCEAGVVARTAGAAQEVANRVKHAGR